MFFCQATNEVVTLVPESTQEEMLSAVQAAKDAFPAWSSTTILTRQQIMFKFQDLIKKNMVWYVCMFNYLIILLFLKYYL